MPNEAEFTTRLYGVLFRSIARKPRTLRQLATDLPGEEWSVRDISAALLALRAAGYVRFLDGAWRTGVERGWLRMGPVLSHGSDGGWDHFPGKYHLPTEADEARAGPGGPSR